MSLFSNIRISKYSDFVATVLCVLILGCSLTMTSSYATSPSIIIDYLHTDELLTLTKTYFGPGAFTEVQNIVSGDSANRSGAKSPYDPSFRSLDQSTTLKKVFRYLWTATNQDKTTHPFRQFIADLNRKPVLRSLIRSPHYSGCLLVVAELQQEAGHQYMVLRYQSHQFTGCQSTYGQRFETRTRFTLP
ncbi:MAG: hypothetical protein O2999_13750 [Nitrospirae bacterium]|nr:hypothetical protein [Nitrospirota bacterium]MDA1305332.1 hypothetical protein [Nitrospirota bacterium]